VKIEIINDEQVSIEKHANLTNKLGLPRTFYNAVARDEHEGADYSASQMTKPGQMVVLENRHGSKVVEDVSERVWSMFGSAVHSILQQGEDRDHLVEQYFKANIGGVSFSGICDLYEDAVVWDYKVTSAWSWVYKEDKMDDFSSQLNIYAWFYRNAGYPVTAAKICMILRDWVASKAKYDQSYPQSQVQVLPIKLMSHAEVQAMIGRRIAYYESLKDVPDEALPECTPEERWAKPPKYAAMKKGVKKASRVMDTKEEIETWIKLNGGKFTIQEREGDMWKRCEYCRVKPFCHQYKIGHEE
jgi:hypothetical protein